MRSKHSKKLAILGIISITSLASIEAWAAESATEAYLRQIKENTYGILLQVNNLPNYLKGLGDFIISWMTPDDSQSTSTLQGSFATLGSVMVQSWDAQNNNKALQNQILADALGVPVASFNSPPNTNKTPPILSQLPNINDVAYSSLLGQPPVPKAPKAADAPYNYLKNIAGVSLMHTMPGLNWQGDLQDQLKYANYYSTMMAVESFNGYILSGLYAEAQGGNNFTTAQQALITQASSSSWIADISTEELGKVLRQILMFESQSYVLLSQLVQTEKQILLAQTMNNSLLMLSQQISESILVAKAQGVNPR